MEVVFDSTWDTCVPRGDDGGRGGALVVTLYSSNQSGGALPCQWSHALPAIGLQSPHTCYYLGPVGREQLLACVRVVLVSNRVEDICKIH